MTPTLTAFIVPGPPATKGSTVSFLARHGRRIVTRTDSAIGPRWARDVGRLARAAGVQVIPKDVGVYVNVDYEFTKPARTKRDQPCVRPDVDKLARALLDALTGVAYEDDGQVVILLVRKRYGPDTLARVAVGTV